MITSSGYSQVRMNGTVSRVTRSGNCGLRQHECNVDLDMKLNLDFTAFDAQSRREVAGPARNVPWGEGAIAIEATNPDSIVNQR